MGDQTPTRAANSTSFAFCPHCGGRYGDTRRWPRECPACGRKLYRNPLPVGVVLLPVVDRNGLLAVRRAIEPGLGELALPGGYLDFDDADWQAGMARELREETGVRVRRTSLTLFHAASAAGMLIVFGLAKGVHSSRLPAFTPNAEISGLEVLTGPVGLAFPTHTEAVRLYFDRAAAAR